MGVAESNVLENAAIHAAGVIDLMTALQWYAGVTSAQVVFMTIPCLMLRAHGFRFMQRSRPDYAQE